MVMAVGMTMGCADKPTGYDSFELTPRFKHADRSKTTWSDNGLFWTSGDKVIINGQLHMVSGSGSTWQTTGEYVAAWDDGNFYIASPASSGGFNSTDYTYGPLTFNGDNVPLACVGGTNKLTLYPCCAVLKVEGLTNNVMVELYTDNRFDTPVEVPMGGKIDIAGACITDGNNYTSILEGYVSGDNSYFIIPMTSGSIHAALMIYDDDGNYGETNDAYTISKGTLYTIDPANF